MDNSINTLNLIHYGEGTPTVIFESGLGDDNSVWTTVQPEISKYTRTFSYSRAGLIDSDTGVLPRTSLKQVQSLHSLLNKENINGPYIIVAHSIAGYNARLFAGMYPKEVCGIIFVDCSHENQFEDRMNCSSSEEIEKVKIQLADAEQTLDELLISANQVKEIRKKDSLRNIPIVVITAGHEGDKSSVISEETWSKYQKDLLSLSDYSKHIFLEDSSHYIQIDKPQVLIDTTKSLIENLSDL